MWLIPSRTIKRMTENIGSESLLKKTHPAADVQVGQDWLGEAAFSALEHFKSNPVETVGGALLVAGAGLAALRFKTHGLEDLAQFGLKRTGLLAKEEPAAAMAMDEALSGHSFVSKVLPVSESTSVKSPFVLRRSNFERQSGDLPELSTLQPPKVSFDALRNLDIPKGSVGIPSFSLEAGIAGAKKIPVARMRMELPDSPMAQLYMGAKDGTVQILRGKRGGSGFFIEEEGIIATAGHVVPDASIPLKVRLASGEMLPARLIAREERSDLALLKVDKLFDRPAPLSLAEFTQDVSQGRRAYLVGHPSSVREKVMTEGRILKYKETLNPDWSYARVRYDVPSYYGNSGGPLILDNGLVAAVHTNGDLFKAHATGTSFVHLRQMLDSVSKRGFRGIDVSTDAARYFTY